MSFMIVGLPRHRTAWLANFFTYDDLFCYHEGIDNCYSLFDYKYKIDQDGDSNTFAYHVFDLNRDFKDYRKIIIDPTIVSFEHTVDFAEKMGHVPRSYIEGLRLSLSYVDGLHVSIDDIDRCLPALWEHVTNKPFDKRRAEMLCGMIIKEKDVYHYNVESLQALMKQKGM